MSSMPPPPQQPPYDPRTQWRVYREQQKAAWRAQRDAMRAQHHAWRGAYVQRVPSIVGPVILVAIGIIALLIYTGAIQSSDFWSWYGRWWPILLIGAGLALLGEWFLDQRRETPIRRGGGFVGPLIFLAVIGVVAAGVNNHWDNWHSDWGNHDDFFNGFGRPQHDQDQQVLNTTVPANAVIQIQNPRGDISITATDGNAVQVQAHQIAYADSDEAARKIFDAEKADVTVSGGNVVVKSNQNNSGRVNLTVVVPKSAQVTVEAGHGDVSAAGLAKGATVTESHGDVHLNDIVGSVQVHFSSDKGDFSAHQVAGDISADGRCNDLTLSEVKGKITVTGDIFGEAHLENLIGGVHLHTSRTDLQFGDLPGDMTLNDDDLRITEAKGGVRVTTKSKNVDLSQISGDTYVDTRDGDVSIEMAGPYAVDAHNSSGHGDVSLTLPANASATIDARTHNGDIISDFPMPSTGDSDDKTARLVVGAGAAKITLSTEVGDVRIKKSSGNSAESSDDGPAPPPKPPKAPHLKPPSVPAESVTQ